MTNADMSIEEMRQSYRLRWAIELIFKTWKSDFDLDKIKNVNQYRYLVMLYAKLIVLLLSSASVRQIILRAEHRNRKKISFHSAMSLFRKHYLMRILDCLRTGDFKKINKLFSEAEAHFIRNCIYQPKKNPPEKDSLDSIFEQVQKLEKLYA